MKISWDSLKPRIMTLNYRHTQVRFPVWEGPKGVVLFSTLDARRYLGLEGISSLKEWFALDFITGDMVVDVRYLSRSSFENVIPTIDQAPIMFSGSFEPHWPSGERERGGKVFGRRNRDPRRG